MAGIRKDIAKLGGDWAPELLWYARAVSALRNRLFEDRTSWTYLAAIHGINPDGWVSQRIIDDINVIPDAERRFMFNQCQHAGWFFLPWHRGYLWAFEAIVANWIGNNGGPADWSLPYWNYLNDANPNARALPREFIDTLTPDNVPNPLAQVTRGPARVLGPQPWIDGDISLDAQSSELIYTADPGTLGYGGPISGFAQDGNAPGGVEANPHNFVHVMVGGDESESPLGWMFDPNFAGLDPIFWVHHCNIDRLWEAWMSDASHQQENGKAWGNGPFPRRFAMPDANGDVSVFAPAATLPGAILAPTYDDLVDGTGINVGAIGLAMNNGSKRQAESSELFGANDEALVVGNDPVRSRLSLVRQVGVASSAQGAGAFRIYLNAEGVRGTAASGVLTVSINRPGVNTPETSKTMAFFGLANATARDGPHSGVGLTGTVDVTDIVRGLGVFDVDGLDAIDVEVRQPGSRKASITVDKLSLYAKAG